MKKSKTKETGVYLLADGRYRVRATAKCPATGRMLEAERTLPHGAHMIEAIETRDRLKADLRSRSEADEAQEEIRTLRDYSVLWLEDKAAVLKPSTAAMYLSVLHKKVLPELGDVRLDRLTRRDVLSWVAWAQNQRTLVTVHEPDGKRRAVEGDHYTTPTLQGWWRVLVQLLRDAHADGYLDADPTYRVDSPKTNAPPKRERRTLTAEQLGRFVELVREHTDRYAEVITLAYTGMRAGELFALEWSDLDYDTGQITVNKSVWNGEVGTTKTGVGRIVPMPDVVADALREHRKKLIRRRHVGLSTQLVFPSDVGTYRSAGSLRKALELCSVSLGLDLVVTPQVLRRTFNTLLVGAQVDRIVVRSILGHSSEEMTQRYAGVGLDLKRDAVSRIVTWDRGLGSGSQVGSWDPDQKDGEA